MSSSSHSHLENQVRGITERTPLLPQPQAEETEPIQASAQNVHDEEAEPLPWSILVPALGSLWLVLFLAAMDGTIVVTLASVISSSFNASEKSSWLGSSYLLTVCAFSPIYGRLSDIIGRKGSMLTAVTFFTLGNLGCALAPTMDTLLFARAFAGIGGGGVLLCGSIILTDLVSIRQRGVYQGLTNILFGAGAGLGGPVGGLLSDHLGWRSTFMLQIPLLILASFSILTFIEIETPASEQTLKQKLARIDYLGSLLLILGVSSMLLSLSFLSANNIPFTDPKVYGLLIASIVFVLLFILVEGYLVKEPILPLKLLTSRATICVGAFYFFSSIAYYAFIFNFAIYFQAVRLQSSKEAGLHLLPLSAFTSSGSLLAGIFMRQTGKYFLPNIFCSILAITGSFYMVFWNESTSQLGEYLGACPSGFGIAANYTFLLIALLAKVKKSEQAVATGMIYLFRSLGQVVGVALSGALLQSLLTGQLRERLRGVDEKYISIIRHDTTAIHDLPPKIRFAATQSYAFSLQKVFIAVTVTQIFCIALCVGVGDGDLAEKKKVLESREEEVGTDVRD